MEQVLTKALDMLPWLVNTAVGGLLYTVRQEIKLLNSQIETRESNLEAKILSTVNGKYVRSAMYADHNVSEHDLMLTIRDSLQRQIDELKKAITEKQEA